MEDVQTSEQKKTCNNCGAEMKYKPGSEQIACDYCGFEAFIESSRKSFEELELDHYLKVTGGDHVFTDTIELLHCKNCGASQHVAENYKSLACVYCGEPLIREDAREAGWILPGALVPFQIDAARARQLFRKWVRGLWFAPGKLKRAALDPEAIHGLYLPYWTFDGNLQADYTGQRGDYYYETQRVRTREGTKTRQVRKTRWTPASGRVSGFVDDILIPASRDRKAEVPTAVTGWRLGDLRPFDSDYLSGFVTEKYSVSLKEGHQQSFRKAREIARTWIRRDIGGDTQRIDQTDIRLSDETFKHILLPVYISSYSYKGRTYNFYINGQTSAIHGSRPYSTWKIVLLILAVLVVAAAIGILTQ